MAKNEITDVEKSICYLVQPILSVFYRNIELLGWEGTNIYDVKNRMKERK